MKPTLTILAALLLAGCATTPQPNSRNTERAEPVITIDIHSLPPGACVWMNAEYIGTTPLQIKVVADSLGNWKKPTGFQVQVPQDPFAEDTSFFPAGSRVPSRLLFRVPNYVTWYSATRRFAPKPPVVTF